MTQKSFKCLGDYLYQSKGHYNCRELSYLPKDLLFKPAVSAQKTYFSLEIHQAIMDYRIKKGNEFLQFCFIYFSDFFSWPSNLCCRIGSLSYSDLQIACYFWCGDTWEEIVKDTGEEKGQG